MKKSGDSDKGVGEHIGKGVLEWQCNYFKFSQDKYQ